MRSWSRLLPFLLALGLLAPAGASAATFRPDFPFAVPAHEDRLRRRDEKPAPRHPAPLHAEPARRRARDVPNVAGPLNPASQPAVGGASAGSRDGTLTWGRARGRVSTRSWAIGGEDLTYAAGTNRIYTLTEHPGLRAVFGFHAQAIGL
jgi:hypothetical protein